VWHLLRDLSTETLMRVVAGLETRIIAGVATHDDIDTYVQAQWEIGQRTHGFGNGGEPTVDRDGARL
jgi:hypothetical protein